MYFRGLIHKGIMYKTFIMENCYLFYLIRNLLKQNYRIAYGIMFLGISRLKNNCYHLLHFFLPILIKLQSYLLICSMNENGNLKKKYLHWMDACSNCGSVSPYLCNLGQVPYHQTPFLPFAHQGFFYLLWKVMVKEVKCWCRECST